MNPEYLHDAMNFLDDDLIEETDALRQGRQTLRPRPILRRAVRIIVPAACAALVVGAVYTMPFFRMGADNAEGSKDFYSQSAESFLTADQNNIKTNGEVQYGSTTQREAVTCGSITLSVPMDWGYYTESGENGSYYIILEPGWDMGTMRVGYVPNFGVCGTGLREEEITIAGMRALVGTYDGSSQWSHIVFPEVALEVLETIEITEEG